MRAIEIGRFLLALKHTGDYLVHAGESDHHRLGEVTTHAAETFAGLRRFDKKRHEARWRNPIGAFLFARRDSPRHPKNRAA